MVIMSFEYLQSVWGSHIQVSPVVLYPVLCQVHLQQEVNNRYTCMNIYIHTYIHVRVRILIGLLGMTQLMRKLPIALRLILRGFPGLDG